MTNWLKLAKDRCKQLTSRDSGGRFHAIKDLGSILTPSYRSKWPQKDSWSDEHYSHYLEQFGEADGMNNDCRWTLNQLLHLADSVSGDTAEFGTFSGASSHIICQANTYATCQGRRHHVFDAFEGLSKIAFFYLRMTDGGVVLVGDYGITSRQGVTEAVDEFLSDRPERMLRLSGGGGFLLKGIRPQLTRSAFAAI